jgi:hypothetical protein
MQPTPLVSPVLRFPLFETIAQSCQGHAPKQDEHQRSIREKTGRVGVGDDVMHKVHDLSTAVAKRLFHVQINVKNDLAKMG